MTLTLIEQTRVDQAVEALSRYNKPFITDFVSKKKRAGSALEGEQQKALGIPQAKYDKSELCSLLGKILRGEYTGPKKYSLSLDELIRYLDKLQETGRQHLYLFKLPEDRREELLRSLRTLDNVKALFGGDSGIYDKGITIWESRSLPRLARVRYDTPLGSSEAACLVAKWIETRVYFRPKVDPLATTSAEMHGATLEEDLDEEENDESEPGKYEEKVHVSVPFEERAATFLIIRLTDGECELRIQAVRGRGRAARQNQLAMYVSMISDCLGCELVGPAVLAPAIRRALILRDIPIVRCEAILPDGAQYIGKRKGQVPAVDPTELQAGVIIRFDWAQPTFGGGRVELDGRLDEIGILRPLRPESHAALVETVRQWRQDGLGSVEPAGYPEAPVSGPSASDAADSTASSRWDAVRVFRSLLGHVVRAGEPATQMEIDRAVREYVHTHAIEEQCTTGAKDESDSGDISASPISDGRSLKQFLDYISEVARTERSSFQREIKLVQGEERRYFQLSVIAAGLALTVLTTGAFLVIFFPAKVAIATVTAILGLVTGRGTLIMRSSMKSLRAKRELIQSQQRNSHETLLAIQAALAIPDSSIRSRAMTEVSAVLLNRVPGLATAARSRGEKRDSNS